jgi:hypothetical protein
MGLLKSILHLFFPPKEKKVSIVTFWTDLHLDRNFDDLLIETQDEGLTYEQIEYKHNHEQLQKIKDWNSRYGYTLNIYSNEHLISGKKHFHFDNKEKGIYAKIDFAGNVLEIKGKNIPSNIEKNLRYFLNQSYVRKMMEDVWSHKNPNL